MQTIRSDEIPRESADDSAVALQAEQQNPPTAEVVANPEPPSPPAPETAAPKSAPYGWILNPTIDILFSCGGIIWIFYAILQSGVAPVFGKGPAASGLWLIAMGGAYIFNNAHQPATLFRVYGSEVTRKAMGNLCTIFGIIAVVLCAPALFNHTWASFIIKITLVWSTQHFSAQAFGIALIYCYKRGYFLSKLEKDSLFVMMNMSCLLAAVRMFTYALYGEGTIAGFDYAFIKLFPDWFCNIVQVGFLLSVCTFSTLVVKRYIEKKQMFPLPSSMTVMTCLLVLTADRRMLGNLLLFTQTYFHSTQYLVVSSAFYFKERGLPEGMPLSRISRMLLKPIGIVYFLGLVLFGSLISVVLPGFLNSNAGIPAALAFGTVYCMLNLHHYLVDAFIWKMRDPQIRKLLVA